MGNTVGQIMTLICILEHTYCTLQCHTHSCDELVYVDSGGYTVILSRMDTTMYSAICLFYSHLTGIPQIKGHNNRSNNCV